MASKAENDAAQAQLKANFLAASGRQMPGTEAPAATPAAPVTKSQDTGVTGGYPGVPDAPTGPGETGYPGVPDAPRGRRS